LRAKSGSSTGGQEKKGRKNKETNTSDQKLYSFDELKWSK
jgi:hypothetical protein